MKKTLKLLIVLATLLGTSCSANRWYVSSQGDDANKGTSEQAAYKTLAKAIRAASAGKKEGTIMVIGVLDAESEGDNEGAVFVINQAGKAATLP